MDSPKTIRLHSLFRWVIAKRYWIVGFYLFLLGPAVYFSLKVKQDNSTDRLIVKEDADFQNSQSFEKVFGKQEPVVLFFDTSNPFDPAVLSSLDTVHKALAELSSIQSTSILTIYNSLPGRSFDGTPESAEAIKHFVLPPSTDLFVKQGLVDLEKGFLSIQVLLISNNEEERRQALHQIDNVINIASQNSAITNIRKVGQLYVNDYLDQSTRRSGIQSFLLFGAFVIILNWLLYRSFRALLAFIIPLLVSTVLTVGYIGLTGGTFTIVSSLIPMTILITCTATLVYIHSRFVERPNDRPIDEHQVFSLANKFLACTASIFATAIGFAALVVSKIRPIREMGIWVAVGLIFTWIVLFTLFPALQKIFKTPTEQERKVAGQWFLRMVDRLPAFSYRFRYFLVGSTLLICIFGVVSLFGIPKILSPMRLQTNALEYINPKSKLYQDTKTLEKQMGGLSPTELWLIKKADAPKEAKHFNDLSTVLALNDFARSLENSQAFPARIFDYPTLLRMMNYFQSYLKSQTPTFGLSFSIPNDQLISTQGEWDEFINALPSLFQASPSLQSSLSGFVTLPKFEQTRISVFTKNMNYEDFLSFQTWIKTVFTGMQKVHPELGDFELKIVGSGPLQAKISHYLVPTLTESFGITVVIIFGAFLIVFRNGAARIMAMIPSLFAILAMFFVMRLFGMTLNIATILIASTVLGTSENDQIHFFYHYQEGKKDGSTTEKALKHTFLVAGRAIFFATLINAGGFLAFALADLPPIRQFGILSSLAFLFSMIADFTALPAALWMVFRERPDRRQSAKDSSNE